VKLPVLSSLALHVVAIALLLTIRAPEQPRVRVSRVTTIASPYRAPAPLKFRPQAQFLRPLPTVARTFRVPASSPQPESPRLTLAIPDPPSIHPDILPPAGAPAVLQLPPPRVLKAAGFSALDIRGPTPLSPAPLVTGGFDSAAGSHPAAPRGEATSHQITSGTFGDATVDAIPKRLGHIPDVADYAAAEILSKPRPAYTDEARRLRIEGEVLLEVLFTVSGEVRVVHMIRGLGNGLDESAIAAARMIQFRPATRGAVAVDSTAVVHIVFQLAY